MARVITFLPNVEDEIPQEVYDRFVNRDFGPGNYEPLAAVHFLNSLAHRLRDDYAPHQTLVSGIRDNTQSYDFPEHLALQPTWQLEVSGRTLGSISDDYNGILCVDEDPHCGRIDRFRRFSHTLSGSSALPLVTIWTGSQVDLRRHGRIPLRYSADFEYPSQEEEFNDLLASFKQKGFDILHTRASVVQAVDPGRWYNP